MTLYFFHCSDLEGRHSDTWGLDLADTDSVREVAPTFLTDIPPPESSRWRAVEVEDEMGRLILNLTVPPD
jgi:hypothetical protein